MAKKSLLKRAFREKPSTGENPFDATDLARNAIIDELHGASEIGSFVSVEFDDEDRVATYLFEAKLAGYKGWRWCNSCKS